MNSEIYRFENLVVDCGGRLVTVNGQEVKFLRHEYQVLCLLLARIDAEVKIADALHQIWGPEYQNENELLHVAVSRIRRKLGRLDPSLSARIKNIYGSGYVFLNKIPGDQSSHS